MKEVFKKIKTELQTGDIKLISERSGIAYATVYKAINGLATSRKNPEILKAVTDFLEERKSQIERLETVLN